MLLKKLTDLFYNEYKQTPVVIRAPGRINIIGEHTDYNDGFVLPAAIDKAAYLAISMRDDDAINLFAVDLNERFSITLKDLKPVGEIGWPNYILGVVAQFQKKGIPLRGFNAILTSDIPIGAGLSSSAAVECATAVGLNELLKTNLDKIELVKMAQKAEHEYAGVRCGIMDQFASMMGKKDHVIKLDCRSLEYTYVPFKLDGYSIVLLNTNVKHSLASSEYNTRRKECEQAVAWVKESNPEVSSLRDASEAMLDQHVLPKDSTIDMRSRFIIQEIDRLQKGCEDLLHSDIKALGEKMFYTHDGLSKMYEVSCKELDFLVDQVRDKKEVIGARMMGGGFGGCTINLVKDDSVEHLIQEIRTHYEMTFQLPLDAYVTSIEDGTRVLR